MVYRGGKLDIKMRVSTLRLAVARSLVWSRPSLINISQIEAPDKSIVYDRLIFSNIDDASGAMLSTIVKKGARA